MLRRKRKADEVELPPVEFTAAGKIAEDQEENLENAQKAPGFPDATLLIADGVVKRVNAVMLDYGREAVSVRYQIDGVWHNLPSRDRASGDAMLLVLKSLAGLNPKERKAKQHGRFKVKFHRAKGFCKLTSQGVKTGERVVLEMFGDLAPIESLEATGMREKTRIRLTELMNADSGLILMSSPPKGGLTTTWTTSLGAADRFVRDFVSVQSEDFEDPEVVNVMPKLYPTGQSPTSILRKVLLGQPNVVVIPELTDGETATALCDQVLNEQMLAITRIHAKSPEEALLRVLMLKTPPPKFARAVTAVLNVRLVRRLCEECKQPYPTTPQLLKQLGIPPGRITTFYRPWQPPQQGQTDEKGNSADWQCPHCNGLGYYGQIGIFELLEVDDRMRQAIVKSPKLEILRKIGRQPGKPTLQEEGILLICQGITSLAEVQRVMKQ